MFDGVFIHYLINELKQIENVRINKVNSITDSELFFTLSTRNKLLISINSNSMHIRLTNMDLINSPIKNNFHQILKKYLESSIINKVTQKGLDRIIIFEITHYDELGYLVPIKLITEFFGRNSNMILTDENYQIIDCYKRCFDDKDNEQRIILPKNTYSFPISSQINPFTEDIKELNPTNIYEGVSSLLFNQMVNDQNKSIITSEINPTVFELEKKNYFYIFDLSYLPGNHLHFSTISEMLEYYYTKLKNDISLNNEQIFVQNYINKEIKKITQKINKQTIELQDAKDNLKYEQIGNLLASNLHLVQKGMKEITVNNFYNNYEEFKITLDPLLSPRKNLEHIFNKYQKAKRSIDQIEKQIELSNNDLLYYECLLNQLNISKITDIYEIIKELDLKNNKTNKSLSLKTAKKAKPNITTYYVNDEDIIFVGKNNIQNNYVTHTLANSFDYFFHVQAVPGSHVILRTKNLTSFLINLAGTVAAYYSTSRNSSNVCIDYTQVKNIKKVPGMKGSFVTYTNYKSVFCKPDLEYIKNNTKQK